MKVHIVFIIGIVLVLLERVVTYLVKQSMIE